MTTHDSESEVSESELAGRLGASLTPRVPRITVEHRGEQSSGLFDLGALYAASVDQVMKRARTVRDQPPVVGIAEIVAPVQASPLQPWPRAPLGEKAAVAEFEADPEPEPLVRARGIGWFGVAVAWFAVALIGAAVATMMLPGPTFARARAAASAAVARARAFAGAPVAVTAAPPTSPVLPAPLVLPVTLPAPPTLPASAPSTISALSVTHPVVATPEPAPAASPKKATPATYARPRPAVRSAPAADAPAPPPPPAKAVAIAETPAPKAAAPSTPAAQPAAGGDSSLEAMMRRAVEADAKRR